jgi:hypothetical protein
MSREGYLKKTLIEYPSTRKVIKRHPYGFTHEIRIPVFRWGTAYAIVDENRTPIILPYTRTKTEARKIAKELDIILKGEVT